MTSPRWTSGAPRSTPAHALLVAPHPDDETFGYAGLLRWLLDNHADCQILAVTDGEASHASSRIVDPGALMRRRLAERRRALEALGAAEVRVARLGLPDGRCALHQAAITDAIVERARDETCIVVPWRGDDHPDHRAAALAGAAAARTLQLPLWEVPIWGRVHGVTEPCSVLDLGAFHERKLAAAMVFRSQIVALGPSVADGPVLRAFELEALAQSTELVVMR